MWCPQSNTGGFTIPAIGRKPVAELHWAGRSTGGEFRRGSVMAAQCSVCPRELVNKWNAWYLRMLEAEGALFMGDKRVWPRGHPTRARNGATRYPPRG